MTCIAGIYILFLSAFLFIHHGKENENAEIGYVSAIAAVVKRIFKESCVGDVAVDNIRILNVFKKKISVLQTAYGRASKAGEKSLANLLNGWKTGPKYRFRIYSNEVAMQKGKTQCEILRGQIKNHSHATHLICIFAKTFVEKFDPFHLVSDLANLNFIQMVALSHFIFNS